MLWKRILLEFGALSGFGGGIGGWFGINGQGILVESSEETSYLKKGESLKIKQGVKDIFAEGWGRVKELNRTVLGSWKWQSEGVSEDFLFVEGWDGGRHKKISSDMHSQGDRNLWNGRKLSFGFGWFGPRDLGREINKLKNTRETFKDKSYWPAINKAGGYIDKQDWEGLSQFWNKRNRDLEEDIFGLYKGRDFWVHRVGEKNGLVDLTFNFDSFWELLSSDEKTLRDEPWTFGILVDNPELRKIRLVGNLEEVAFNYLKKVAWSEAPKVKSLKEKKIMKVVFALQRGEPAGFDCEKGNPTLKGKYFKECEANLKVGEFPFKVQAVIKTTVDSDGYRSPSRNSGGLWRNQPKIDAKDKEEILKLNSSLEEAFILNEKCEEFSFSDYIWDLKKKIRQEVCDWIIRPWFGDLVEDKRLCLMKSSDISYYFRLMTFLKILQVPSWNDKNTFWTKCSNFGI